VLVYEIPTGKLVTTRNTDITKYHYENVYFHPTTHIIVSIFMNRRLCSDALNIISFYDLDLCEIVGEISDHATRIDFTKDGTKILLGSHGEVNIFDFKLIDSKVKLETLTCIRRSIGQGFFTKAKFTPDQKYVVIATEKSYNRIGRKGDNSDSFETTDIGGVYLYNIETTECYLHIEDAKYFSLNNNNILATLGERDQDNFSIGPSMSENHLIVVDYINKENIYRRVEGTQSQDGTISRKSSCGENILLSPDGLWVAKFYGYKGCYIKVYNSKTGKVLFKDCSIEEHGKNELIFSCDSKFLFVATNRNITIYSIPKLVVYSKYRNLSTFSPEQLELLRFLSKYYLDKLYLKERATLDDKQFEVFLQLQDLHEPLMNCISLSPVQLEKLS
jgi:hypothetical protein